MGFDTNRTVPLPAMLIFNPVSGQPRESPNQLVEILSYLQAANILPEVFLVEPNSHLPSVAANAIERGIRFIIVSGGDGTIDSVMGSLVGTEATLGILPTGTRNNIAFSLGVPSDNLEAAVQILRNGHRLRIDVGHANCSGESRYFLEACSVGLLSALFPAADDIQHGNFARIGDLLSTLITSPPAEFHIQIDQGLEKLDTQAHVLLVANMPYIGARFQAGPDISFDDSHLDVFIYSNLSKLDLIGVAVQATGGGTDDPRIQRYRVRQLAVETEPKLPVMADGFALGEGPLKIELYRHGLAVMAGETANSSLVARSLADQETE